MSPYVLLQVSGRNVTISYLKVLRKKDKKPTFLIPEITFLPRQQESEWAHGHRGAQVRGSLRSGAKMKNV